MRRLGLLAGALAALMGASCLAAEVPPPQLPDAPVDEAYLYQLRIELGNKYQVWFQGAPCRKDPAFVCYAVIKSGLKPKELGRVILKKGRSRKAFRAEFEKKLAALAGKPK